MNLPWFFDPLVIFAGLLAAVWVGLAVVGIFRRSGKEESSDPEN